MSAKTRAYPEPLSTVNLRNHRVNQETPGFAGIFIILGAVVGIALLMTIVLGMWSHWIPIIAAIIVSLWAVQSINK
jgi:hypothetical protein